MDYFLEVAQHPDIHEAIVLVEAADGGVREVQDAARRLLEYDFLCDEHRTAWTAEVVHRFYGEPRLAAEAWRLLRYCRSSRLALISLAYAAGRRMRARAPEQTEELTEDERMVRDADALQRARIDELCDEWGLQVEAPFFLRSVLEASGVPSASVAEKVCELLACPADVRDRARKHGVAVPFSIMLDGELDQIEATRTSVYRTSCSELDVSSRTPPPAGNGASKVPFRRALEANLLGLAFSGGGIRSATFNLGILQAFSTLGLLRHVDYLSTVSGGGYIGSWLAAWIRRESVAIGTKPPGRVTMLDMQRRLAPNRSPNPMDERLRPIRFLREYSNYLTPRSGFFSADTWTMVGIYLRNTLLNQIIIVCFLAAALLVPRLWFVLMQTDAWEPAPYVIPGLWAFGVGVLSYFLWQLRLPSRSVGPVGDSGAAPRRMPKLSAIARPVTIHVAVVLPWASSIALVAAILSRDGHWVGHRNELSLWAGAIVGGTFFLMVVLGGAHRCWFPRARPLIARTPWRNEATRVVAPMARKVGIGLGAAPPAPPSAAAHRPSRMAVIGHRLEAYLVMALSAAVAGAIAAGLTWVLLRILASFSPDLYSQRWHGMALGTAGLMSVLSLSVIALLGMLGEKFPDEHREWWSRFRTCLHVWAVAWFTLFVAAMYVPWAFHHVLESVHATWAGPASFLGWVASTLFGVLRGRTAEDDVKQEHEGAGAGTASASALRMATTIAPYVFIVGLVVAISLAIDRVYWASLDEYKQITWRSGGYWEFAQWTARDVFWTPLIAPLLVAVGLLFSWRVDINDFSLHHFYKNRLVRCYLGASHVVDRRPDWFTGFDPRDDVRLEEFDHKRTGQGTRYPHHAPYAGPYPLLNCALNLVGGEDLAWQERKSASFVFTPKYCGYDVDRAVLTKTRNGLRQDAYVPTYNYYHPGEGPLLGMAMAISGAAANPNMGRASSPALAFLMTVFNVRLGWWLRNPRNKDGAGRTSPRIGLPYTALELFGGTDDRRKFVNLSDGGHFENLGVYELIRRGCRYIVVCDAGQDQRFTCEDLGTLVRLCRTDFGVEIDIDLERVRALSGKPLSETHCVVGKIHYHALPRRSAEDRLVNEDDGPLLRGSRPAHEEGYLLYIKASMTGDEPQDVLEYFRRVPGFPHQTTADQWFDESQFESYRKLGMHIGETAFCRYQNDDTTPLADVGELFRRLHGFWYPPVAVINERSTSLVAEYTRIVEAVRANPNLQGFDRVLFEGVAASASPPALSPRDELYMANSLIQLMENVYADLDLERLWQHPHVMGWVSVFERWAQMPEFRRTWRVVDKTYAERFRNFYNDRLKGRSLWLPNLFIAGHRGVPSAAGIRENTLPAFEAALKRGANVIEMDVPDALTLAAGLGALKGRVQLVLDLKSSGIEQGVCDALRAGRWNTRDYVITSTDPQALENVCVIDPSIRTGLVVDHPDVLNVALGLPSSTTLAPKFAPFFNLRADFLSVDEQLLTDERLQEAKDQRIPLVPWTVNTWGSLVRLLRHEAVIGVITDDVKEAVKAKAQL